jgi:hypothetical protein
VPFSGTGCMVPQLFAAGGNRSYLEFLGHNWWPMVPGVNYPDSPTSRSFSTAAKVLSRQRSTVARFHAPLMSYPIP